jgi:hypothetical protein
MDKREAFRILADRRYPHSTATAEEALQATPFAVRPGTAAEGLLSQPAGRTQTAAAANVSASKAKAILAEATLTSQAPNNGLSSAAICWF